MHELDVFKAMLDRSGVKYRLDPYASYEQYESYHHLYIEIQEGDKMLGDSRGETEYIFDADGSLVTIGIWNY